jgi:hypothetical protein
VIVLFQLISISRGHVFFILITEQLDLIESIGRVYKKIQIQSETDADKQKIRRDLDLFKIKYSWNERSSKTNLEVNCC